MAESASRILTPDWFDKVEYWRTDGALQCIPIFSIALFCQTQLFEIYQAIPNASLEKMNALIRIAVNICTCVYIFVGIFGYIAFSDKAFTGNVLLSLTPSLLTEVIKIGFVLSLAFSFPLIIFPCRASLFSLIYKPTYTMLHDGGTHFIPETKFRTITVFIILISLIIGILTPNIELVLGLVGSTIGVSICVLFPATCFICMVKKNTNERIIAQMMLCIGIVVMVLGTYANLNAVDDIALGTVTEGTKVKPALPDLSKIDDKILEVYTTPKLHNPSMKLEKNIVGDDVIKEVRHEPPQPIEPADSKEEKPKDNEPPPVAAQPEPEAKEPELKEIRREPPQPVGPEENINEIKKDESPVQVENKSDHKVTNENAPKENISLEKQSPPKATNYANSADQVDAEAIKKEDKEINQQAQEDLKNVVEKLDLISELQKQNQEQQQHIVEQQKKILEEMKQRKDPHQEQIEIDKVKQEKLKAVKEIQDIAKKAIESLVDDPKELLEAKIVPNEEGKPKPINLGVNLSSPVPTTLKANPAPLSYQLGLNVATNDTLINKSSQKNAAFVPLPIVKSGLLASNNSNVTSNLSMNTNNNNKVLEKTISTGIKPESVDLVKNENVIAINSSNIHNTVINQSINVMTSNKEALPKKEEETKDTKEEIKSNRRDILSESDNHRNKRDAIKVKLDKKEEHCEKNKTKDQIESDEESKQSVLLKNVQTEV